MKKAGKWLWKKLDGKKLLTGAAVAGLGFLGEKVGVPGSDWVIGTGLSQMGLGAAFKGYKAKKHGLKHAFSFSPDKLAIKK